MTTPYRYRPKTEHQLSDDFSQDRSVPNKQPKRKVSVPTSNTIVKTDACYRTLPTQQDSREAENDSKKKRQEATTHEKKQQQKATATKRTDRHRKVPTLYSSKKTEPPQQKRSAKPNSSTYLMLHLFNDSEKVVRISRNDPYDR